jgi:abortive infection bacteriophage resistance protein
MKFEKPALTIEVEVELVLSRSMTSDASCFANRLAMTNYYRLTSPMIPGIPPHA